MPDRILADLWDRLSDKILNQPDMTPADLQAALNDSEKAALSAELEMIQKSDRTLDEVQTLFSRMMTEYQRHLLQAEIDRLTAAYFQDPTPDVWETIKSLKQEITALSPEE